jgi:hypothetical protein
MVEMQTRLTAVEVRGLITRPPAREPFGSRVYVAPPPTAPLQVLDDLLARLSFGIRHENAENIRKGRKDELRIKN